MVYKRALVGYVTVILSGGTLRHRMDSDDRIVDGASRDITSRAYLFL
jgi:hypothetical protein